MNNSYGEPFIQLKEVSKIYKDGCTRKTAICNVSLDVTEGEFIGIIGPSGSGKTTLLSLMGCLLLPTEGEVIFEKKNIAGMTIEERAYVRRKKIGFIFQDMVMLERLHVWENVAIPLLLAGNEGNAREIASRWLTEVGLGNRVNSFPKSLSYGERKRIEIARALSANPQVLIADEPTGGLDKKTGEIIMDILVKANNELKKTVIFVTHDDYFVKYANKQIEIRDGKLCIERGK